MQEGSLVFMLPGYQQQLWHNVRKGEAGTRYCISFRKYNTTKPQMTTNIRDPCIHYSNGIFNTGIKPSKSIGHKY